MDRAQWGPAFREGRSCIVIVMARGKVSLYASQAAHPNQFGGNWLQGNLPEYVLMRADVHRLLWIMWSDRGRISVKTRSKTRRLKPMMKRRRSCPPHKTLIPCSKLAA